MKRFVIPIYDWSIHVTTDPVQHRRRCGEYPDDKNDAELAPILGANKALTLWVRPDLTGHALINTIAHESFHAATTICDYHGIDVDPDNDEPVAYLVGFVAGKISQCLT